MYTFKRNILDLYIILIEYECKYKFSKCILYVCIYTQYTHILCKTTIILDAINRFDCTSFT